MMGVVGVRPEWSAEFVVRTNPSAVLRSLSSANSGESRAPRLLNAASAAAAAAARPFGSQDSQTATDEEPAKRRRFSSRLSGRRKQAVGEKPSESDIAEDDDEEMVNELWV